MQDDGVSHVGEHGGDGGTVGMLQREMRWMESHRDQPCAV